MRNKKRILKDQELKKDFFSSNLKTKSFAIPILSIKAIIQFTCILQQFLFAFETNIKKIKLTFFSFFTSAVYNCYLRLSLMMIKNEIV